MGVTAFALGRPISLLLGRNLSSDRSSACLSPCSLFRNLIWLSLAEHPLYVELCRWKRQDKNTKKKLPNPLMTTNYKGWRESFGGRHLGESLCHLCPSQAEYSSTSHSLSLSLGVLICNWGDKTYFSGLLIPCHVGIWHTQVTQYMLVHVRFLLLYHPQGSPDTGPHPQSNGSCGGDKSQHVCWAFYLHVETGCLWRQG